MELITKRQARLALLAHQSLWPPRELKKDQGVADYFARIGSMQFDPVDVAGISPEISLCARVKGFQKEDLQRYLYKERWLCDVWDKNACIAHREDKPHLAQNRLSFNGGWRVYYEENEELAQAIDRVKNRLREGSPLSTQAFRDGPKEREALECLLLHGEVGIHHRQGRRRFFALSDQLLPKHCNQIIQKSDQERTDWLVERRIGAIGLIWNRRSDVFLGISTLSAKEKTASIARLLAQGRILAVEVEGIQEPLYLRTADQEILKTPSAKSRAALLGPLDNLLWDRRLIEQLFGFSYSWEIYTVAEKRVYGSYTLPILYGDQFIGRV